VEIFFSHSTFIFVIKTNIQKFRLGENYRTNSYNKVLEYIFQENNMLKGEKKEETVNNSVSSVSVPGAGIEPAQPCSYWCLRPARLPIPPSGQLLVNLGCKDR
jgi:hypothetical protein